MIALPAENAEKYCKEIEEIEGFPAWIVGKVTPRPSIEGIVNSAYVTPNATIVTVPLN